MTAEIRNLPGLMAELRQIPQIMQTRILKGACATGAAVFKDQVTANALRVADTGTLARAVYMTRLSSECDQNNERWIVGVRRGKTIGKNKRENKNDAFYAAWVEYGHLTRTPGLTAKQHRKARESGTAESLGAKVVPAHPFMRPAFDTKKVDAVRAMEQYVREHLKTAVAGLSVLRAA